MTKISAKTWLTISLASALSICLLLFGMFLGMTLYYVMATTVSHTRWTQNTDGREMRILPVSVIAEGRNTPPFAEHIDYAQRRFRYNCKVDPDTFDSDAFQKIYGFVKDGIERHVWAFPKNNDVPFRFRSLGPHGQTLIRQSVFSQFGVIILDWKIHIDGYVSEDGSHYLFWLRHDGGNFYGCDIEYYVDFNVETQRLTLYIRQKLYRGKHKRYRFEFELQDNPVPSRYSLGEGEIRSVFVPINQET